MKLYNGVRICPKVNTRGTVQGYEVKRMASDIAPLHLRPVLFETEQEAMEWIDNEYDPAKVGHPLTKPDKRPLILK